MGKQGSCFYVWALSVGPGFVLGLNCTVGMTFAPRVWACRPHKVISLFEGPNVFLGCFVFVIETMDGRTLQIFLNEHTNKLDSLFDDVLKSLQLSRNPAQLVLDAMEGFYPPHLMNGET